jgi:Domain of unknown function (DUF6487)
MDENSPESPKVCPKCGGHMTEGFVPEFIFAAMRELRWVEGSATPSFWQGLKTSGLKQYKLTAYRCDGCAFVELSAERPAE